MPMFGNYEDGTSSILMRLMAEQMFNKPRTETDSFSKAIKMFEHFERKELKKKLKQEEEDKKKKEADKNKPPQVLGTANTFVLLVLAFPFVGLMYSWAFLSALNRIAEMAHSVPK